MRWRLSSEDHFGPFPVTLLDSPGHEPGPTTANAPDARRLRQSAPVGVRAVHVAEADESSRTGTRLYQPPESQLNRPATTAGDVYALGVMLYQLVIDELSHPLGTGWEEDLADELLRDDIRACCLFFKTFWYMYTSTLNASIPIKENVVSLDSIDLKLTSTPSSPAHYQTKGETDNG